MEIVVIDTAITVLIWVIIPAMFLVAVELAFRSSRMIIYIHNEIAPEDPDTRVAVWVAAYDRLPAFVTTLAGHPGAPTNFGR